VIRHIVTFVWNEDTTPAHVDAIMARLNRLPELVPALAGYEFVPDLNVTDGTGDFAIIATVATVADLRSYLDHPDHREVARDLRAMARSRTAVQIETTAASI
jgi:hypothetical protein